MKVRNMRDTALLQRWLEEGGRWWTSEGILTGRPTIADAQNVITQFGHTYLDGEIISQSDLWRIRAAINRGGEYFGYGFHKIRPRGLSALADGC